MYSTGRWYLRPAILWAMPTHIRAAWMTTSIAVAICSSANALDLKPVNAPLPGASERSLGEVASATGTVPSPSYVDTAQSQTENGAEAFDMVESIVDDVALRGTDNAPVNDDLLEHANHESWSSPVKLSAGYDRGFFITSDDPPKDPFALKVNFQTQFRYTGFDPTQSDWTDSSGNVLPIANRNDFDINRGRIIFSGTAIDPDLHYYINLDYATLGDDNLAILMAWWNYRFSRAFDFYVGKCKVPGGREWLLTSMYTMAPDRSLATTFFRPSITTGIWARGEPVDRLYYQAGIGNGFNTTTSGFRDLDTNFVYAGNVWYEPQGDFGGTYSDLVAHAAPTTRFGGSVTTSKQSARQNAADEPEQSFIRLSDGTEFIQPNSLAPGVSVNEYSILLATLDGGLKFQGLSLHGEYFMRWLYDIEGSAPIPQTLQSIFDHGFHVQTGAFAIPRRLEIYARTSHVFGDFGNGGEFGSGFNYFFRGTENWRFGTEVTYVNDSPAEQIRTGYDAGASGLLVRSQLQIMY